MDGTNVLQTRYIRGDVVDQIFAGIGSDFNAYWYLTDRLGTIRDITDNIGVVKDTLTYDGFGNITNETSTYAGRYRWTGREYDTETVLQFNRARYYDAATGRWMSQDPLGFDAGDTNLYRYVGNRPTRDTDPSGFDYVVEDPGAFKVGRISIPGKVAMPGGTGFTVDIKAKIIPVAGPVVASNGSVKLVMTIPHKMIKSPDKGEMKQLSDLFPKWTFTLSKKTLEDGTLRIKSYEAWALPAEGVFPARVGASFVLQYKRTGVDPVHIHWIQFLTRRIVVGKRIIDVHEIDGAGKTPYYDEKGVADGTGFADIPYSTLDDAPVLWEAHVFVAEETAVDNKTGGRSVTIWQGASWGYRVLSLPLPLIC